MKVRYGKPIKTTSLVGKQRSFVYNNSSANNDYLGVGDKVYFKNNGSYIRNQGKGVNITLESSHKYFIAIKMTGTLNNTSVYMYYTDDVDGVAITDRYTILNDKITCGIFSNTTKFRAAHLFTLTNSFDTTTAPKYYCLIDLTSLGLDSLTAQEFYNKYKDKLELLASGEEIVLSTKSGNVKGFITEGTTNLISSVDPFNDFGGYGCYNGSTQTYGWGSNTDMYKEVGLFQGKQCVKVYMGTAGRNAWPMPSIKNINPYSTTVNTYCTLSFDYYPTSITSLYPYSFRDGVQINSYLNGRSMNGATITNIPLNQWSHIVIVYKRTTDEYVGAGVEYIRIGTSPHTSTTTDYWLFANVQSEYKDHATPYVNGTRPDNYPISCNIAEKMYGYNQLAPAWTSGSYNGVTISTVENGIQLSGTATGWFTYNKLLNKIIPAGHKVLVSATTTNPNGANLGFMLRTDNSGTMAVSTTNFNQIITLSSSVNNYQIYADLGDNCDGISILNDMIIDLTEWYGAGKEPSTIAEFKETFNKDYYGYCPNKTMLTQGMINALPEYGYNQLFSIGSSNECTRTYDSSKDEYTLTANSSTTHSYFGLTCYGANYNLDSIKGHKALCMAYVSDISISTTFNNISFEWALTSITDYNRVTTAGNYVYGLGTWKGNASVNFINANGGTGYVVGDSFSVNKVMIIDLTDLYGEGNEPSTLAEFKQTFPHKYYPYSMKTPLNKYIINAMASK